MTTQELGAEVDTAFIAAVRTLDAAPRRDRSLIVHEDTDLTGDRALELFDAQLGSRHLDLAARWLRQKRGKGFYTIGSSGHEGNAAVAAALRPTDPALLHYRSGAFFLERARQVNAGVLAERSADGSARSEHGRERSAPRADHSRRIDAVYDTLLGICAAVDEPIAGGRHKVWGNHALAVIPQTSTISSHLPRALGVAFAIERSKKLQTPILWPSDAITITSFGDASANHSTATGAINAACHSAHAHIPVPVLFVCEDNGIGISVSTPAGWIRAAYGSRPGLKYFEADGGDLAEAFDVATEAASWVRSNRRPAFLHVRTVRLMGHAGSDAEATYRTPDQISAEIARDPLVRTAKLLVSCGVSTPAEVLALYEGKRAEVVRLAEKAAGRPQLTTAREVMAPLSPRSPEKVAIEARRSPSPELRARFHEGKLPEDEGQLTLSSAINRTLVDLFATYPELLCFGEDVGKKGGVYGVTKGLFRRVGPARVFDTLLDEQTILGLALGTAVSGLLPIPEIQYLAYLHNAEDQLRGEASSLRFFSNGQYANPMVVRVAGYGYQKGFGGHFHNDDAIGSR
jgi:2-oxoisovalerate dehydrogenase E1 component